MPKKDGHTHTQFSHHGTTEPLSAYLSHAVSQGFSDYTVTEHAPLPGAFLAQFTGPVDARDHSAMHEDELAQYCQLVDQLQAEFQSQLTIHRGFEVDFLVGFEQDTRQFLDKMADWTDEIVISVHFMPNKAGQLAPIDYTPEVLAVAFPEIVTAPQAVFARYFDTVQQSLDFAKTLSHPTKIRIGHLTLIRKYQKYFELPAFNHENLLKITTILNDMKSAGYELDFNSAGLRKPFNGEPYPTAAIARQAVQLGIPLVYGSDAHQVADQGQDYDILENILNQPLDN